MFKTNLGIPSKHLVFQIQLKISFVPETRLFIENPILTKQNLIVASNRYVCNKVCNCRSTV